MLVIENKEHYLKTVKEAKENGTWEVAAPYVYKGLEYQLKYLHEYGGMEKPWLMRVDIGYDRDGFSIGWHRYSEKTTAYIFFMNGGLVFHKSDQSWSVHT